MIYTVYILKIIIGSHSVMRKVRALQYFSVLHDKEEDASSNEDEVTRTKPIDEEQPGGGREFERGGSHEDETNRRGTTRSTTGTTVITVY